MSRHQFIICMLVMVISLSNIPRHNVLAEIDKPFSSDLEAYKNLFVDKLLPGKIESFKVLNLDSNALSVVFSLDGTRLASGGNDNIIRLWDVSTGKEVNVLKGHQGTVSSVVFFPDGTRLASGSYDGTIRLWEVSTGKALKTLSGHNALVLSVAFSPDGTRLASGSSDGTARLWDVSTGKEVNILKGHADYVRSIAFSPDGMRLASGSDDRTIRLWDVSTGKEVNILKGHGGYVLSIAFSPDGMHLVSGSDDKTIRLWEVSTGKVLKAFQGPGSDIRSVMFSTDGLYLISGSHDKTIRLWDISSGEVLKILEGHTKGVASVALSPDGTQLASGSYDNSVRFWKIMKSFDTFMIDGETIDWSKGKPDWPPYPEAKFEVVEGSRIGITAHNNRGKGTVYQLQAETHSKRPEFNQLPIFFGKIEPKQSKMRYLPIPRTGIAQGGTVDLKLTWKELNDKTPPDLFTEINLDELPKPNLVTSLRVVDDGSGQSVGNGDGVLQPGEAVDLILSVKNSGDIVAQDVTVKFTLTDDPSLDVFGAKHPGLGSIPAGEIKDVRFTVQVNRGTSLEEIPVRLDIREASFQISKAIEEKISFAKLEAPLVTFPSSRTMYVNVERAELLSGANTRASILSQASRGTELQVSGRSGDFYRVELEGGNHAWIPLSVVTSTAISSAPTVPQPPPIEPFPGPAIFVSYPPDRLTTESEQIRFDGQVQAIGKSSVTQVYVMVNGAAQVSEKFDAQNQADLRHRLSLRPGENIIEVEARDNRGLKSTKRLLVRREVNTSQLAAVVIGIEKYAHIRPLNYARDDAEAVFSYLTKRLGVPAQRARYLYDEDAHITAIRETLGEWLAEIAGSNDTVIIYYSGHGAVEEDPSSPDGDSLSKYLLPVNAKSDRLFSTAIPMTEVRRFFERIRAKRLIFIVDACYSGGTGGRTIPRPEGSKNIDLALSAQFLDRLTQGEGRWILTASGPNELAREDRNVGHGIFTYHLLQGLNERSNQADTDQDGYVTLRELYTYVSREVASATGQKQRPMLKGEQVGTIPLGHYAKQ